MIRSIIQLLFLPVSHANRPKNTLINYTQNCPLTASHVVWSGEYSHVKIHFSISITNLIWSTNELVSGWPTGVFMGKLLYSWTLLLNIRRRRVDFHNNPSSRLINQTSRLWCPAEGQASQDASSSHQHA